MESLRQRSITHRVSITPRPIDMRKAVSSSKRTTGGSSVVLDGSTLAVESVVCSALEACLAGAVELAAAELAKDGRAQLLSGACGEHGCGI